VKKRIKKLLLFLFSLTSLVFLAKPAKASISPFWKEEFNHNFSQEWQIFDEYEYIKFTESTIRFNVSSGRYYPYIYARNKITPESDYKITIKIKYNPQNYNFGAGLVLEDYFYPERINYSPPASEGIFKIWPLTNNRLGFKSNLSSRSISNCENGCFFYIAKNEQMFQWHELTIIKREKKYYAYIDGAQVFESDPTAKEISYVWIGNPEVTTGPAVWPLIEIDKIEVSQISPKNHPLIIIPGLGASWNTKAMVYGEEVPNSEWQMTPFVNIYNRLIETAKNGGYRLGKDLFVWNYDWRKPLPEIAVKLSEFIENTPKLADAEKIDIVGHSLGGLVGRTWAQSSENNTNKLNKLIAVGSPHQGAVQAYEALAGGKVGNQVNLGWLAMQLLLQIHRQGFETNAEIIRNLAPVLQDITPTFNFLKKYRRAVPFDQTKFYNSYLDNLNQSFNLNQASHFIVGNIGNSTPEWLWLRNRSLLDQILNLWPDGRPYRTINGPGDGTVLVKSAQWEDVEYDKFDLNHHQIISSPDSVAKIMELLGKPDVEIAETDPVYPSDNLLIFYLASPATLRVDGYKPDDQNLQFVVIPNPEAKIYQAEIIGVGTGTYHLYLGQITPSGNYWRTYEDKISPGEKKVYQFAIDFNNPKKDPLIDENGLNHFQEAKVLLEKLYQETNNRYLSSSLNYLDQAIELAQQEDWSKTIDKVKKSLYYLARFQRKLTDSQIQNANQGQEIMKIIATGWENILNHQNLVSKSRAYREYQGVPFQKSKRFLSTKVKNCLMKLRLGGRKRTIRLSSHKAMLLAY